MRATSYFSAVDSHTEGMPTRVITAGLGPIPGDSMQERRLYFEEHLDELRLLLMREPRGHSAMSGAFLQPPTRPDADWGVLFVEVSGCLPMCGHGTIGVATVLVECGMVAVSEPETVIRLDTPAGLVEATVTVSDGRAERVHAPQRAGVRRRARRHASTSTRSGPVSYDMAFGGNFYALIAGGLGRPRAGPRKRPGADRPGPRDRRRDQRVGAAGPSARCRRSAAASTSSSTHRARTASMRATRPRSTRAGSTARRAGPGPRRGWRRSTRAASWRLVRSSSTSRSSAAASRAACSRRSRLGDLPAVVPEVSGRAWITGMGQYLLDPTDPFPAGFAL